MDQILKICASFWCMPSIPAEHGPIECAATP
jgi:hypothetical protein